MADEKAYSQGKLQTMLRALRSRNYRLFFCGQLVSLIGTWLAQVAMSWLAYDLTGSKAMLGLVAFSSQIPSFILGPWAGVMVDRWDLRRTLVVTQMLSMLQSFAVAALALAGVIRPSHIILLAIAQGMINAFDMPGRQAFVVRMVERREDLPNAIALNSTMFNASRLLGPAAAGVLLAWIGPGNCFLLDGFSYLGVIFALLAMRITAPVRPTVHKRAAAALREGWAYVTGSVPIRALLLQLALVSLMGTPYTVLMPVFAKDILKGGPATLGMLTASIGCGALMGGVNLAMRRSVLGLGRWIAIGAVAMGISLVAFSFSRMVPLSMVILACCGFAMITQMASGNTVLQTIVDDDKRGRVMAFYGMAFQGMMPIGSLLAGTLAETRIGAPGMVIICGISCIGAGIWFAIGLPKLREHIRPIYERQGILPPVAEGLKAAQIEQSAKAVTG